MSSEEIEKGWDEGLGQTYYFSVFSAHAVHTSELDGQEMDKQGKIIASGMVHIIGSRTHGSQLMQSRGQETEKVWDEGTVANLKMNDILIIETLEISHED